MRPTANTVIGGAILLGLIGATILAPWIAQDPEAMDLLDRFSASSWGHPLGTDALGRDVLSRLLHGGRVSLAVAALTTMLSTGIGTILGLWSGFYGGRLDSILMRLTDGVMALPLLPLLVVLAAIDPMKLGISAETAASETFAVLRIAVIIALVGWTTVARLVRAQALTIRTRDYVRAATALGASPLRIMRRHLLPNLASAVIVAATLSVGHIILVESALSFLGLGVRPPLASWGNMLTGAMTEIWSAPAQALWPGLAIFLTVLGCNLLGDGLQRSVPARGISG